MKTSDWRVIETAPQDGTVVLGACSWETEPYTMLYSKGEWWEATTEGTAIDYQTDCDEKYLKADPQRWMPLPKLPELIDGDFK